MNLIPVKHLLIFLISVGFLPVTGITGEAKVDATLFPVPVYGGDILERGYLTGDWGGSRTALADQGFQFEFAHTGIWQSVWDGGRARGAEFQGKADYRFKFDLRKMGLWEGGYLQVNGESLYGRNVNRQTGVLLPVNSNALYPLPNREVSAIPNVVFTQFLSEQLGVFMGKLDTTGGDMNDFAWGKGDMGFMNLAFQLNPVATLTTPYSTLGAGAFYLLDETSIVTFSVYDPDGDPTRTGFDEFFEHGTAFSLEGRFGTNFFGKPGHQLIGGTYSNRDYTGLNQDRRLVVDNILNTGALGLQRQDDSWSLYYNFDQYICGGENGAPGWGLFGRLGLADDETNLIKDFHSIGIGGDALFTCIDGDSFGAGYYHMQYSDRLPGLLPRDNYEEGVELYYSFPATPWLMITPDLQIVNSPLRGLDDAIVGGIRGRIQF